MKFKQISYLKYYKEEVDYYTFLLEAGQGKNINGNMYAILKELCTNKKYADYKVYFVVTNDTREALLSRLSFYNFTSVHLVERNSKEYMRLLATCKYLITDNSFPPYYIKKKEQVMLNTWHGTPLKTLGRCDIENSSSISNVQKNFAMSDYILFPNKYTRDIFMEDYCLKNVLNNKVLLADYPRNVAFFDDELKQQIIRRYGLENKHCYAYMPTWRGTSRNARVKNQKETTVKYLQEIDDKLNDDEIFFVNLHFLIGNDLDLSAFKHIRRFPSEYETYDFLNVCDTLVTDYSSVFFDYAVSRQRIILFTYDLKEYMADRGTYFPIEDLPFVRVDNTDELINELHKDERLDYSDFIKTYCSYAKPSTTADILDLLIDGKGDRLIVENPQNNQKKNIFLHIDKIKNKHQEKFVLHYLENLKGDENYIVLFNGKLNSYLIDLIKQMDNNIQIYGYVAKNYFTFKERVILYITSRIARNIFDKTQKKILKREFNRKFGLLKIDEFINVLDSSQYVAKEFYSQPKIKKIYTNIPVYYYGRLTTKRWFKNKVKLQLNKADEIRNFLDIEVDEETKNMFLNNCVGFMRLYSKSTYHNGILNFKLYFLAKTMIPLHFKDMKVLVGGKEVSSQMASPRGKKILNYWYYNSVNFQLNNDELVQMPIQNKIIFDYTDEKHYFGFHKGISYKVKATRQRYLHSKIHRVNDTISCYFRQSKGNTLFLTVRPSNRTDAPIENFKLNLAYYLAKLLKFKHPILLFEKDSNRYEESASVVYEKLQNMGYTNAYFILDKTYLGRNDIPNQYQKNIIDKYSFKHYLYFFTSQTFIGSEALIHALELRASNKKVLNKLDSLDNDYVFLQHGVMYMISLDSESRTFFRPRSSKGSGKYRVVTSSDAEAEHFITLGKHRPEQIIVCGLPKFDKNKWDEDADKIVIMPTWRPWEYNEMNTVFESTKYYQMMYRIYKSIPVKYKDKVIILPHPLVYQVAKEGNFELKNYMMFDVKYDDILKHTKLLITDYSSIAYDAFYRGCNVIFYWEELQECLEAYGPSTKLMLNEGNAYGDICYNVEQLKEVIEKNCVKTQSEKYKLRYQQLVEFHDGHNTDRLIAQLKEENIL